MFLASCENYRIIFFSDLAAATVSSSLLTALIGGLYVYFGPASTKKFHAAATLEIFGCFCQDVFGCCVLLFSRLYTAFLWA